MDEANCRFSGLALVFLAATACRSSSPSTQPPPPPPSSQGVVHDLRIVRHQSAALFEQRADEIVRDMGEVLRRVDGSGDVACDVSFRRSGPVGTFAVGDGIINSAADFQAVLDVPGEIKVVRQINWCGTLAPNIIGCAPVPGGSLAIVRFALDQEGILWVHEYGHNQGLPHRDAEGAVMRAFIDPTHRRVNAGECQAYQ